MIKALLASTSTLHNQKYLEYLFSEISDFFKPAKTILFIPYAQPSSISLNEYTQKASKAFSEIGLEIKGIQDYEDPVQAIKDAEGIFTGGGNTFLLVSELYRKNIMGELREIILNGTPYMGTSAGTNIAGLTMQTTNDMPIVYPPSFKTLGLVPFNINPHYVDPDPASTLQGETRETRIREFHFLNPQPVVGLREGSWLELGNNKLTLKGEPEARIFKQDKLPYQIQSETNLSDLN